MLCSCMIKTNKCNATNLGRYMYCTNQNVVKFPVSKKMSWFEKHFVHDIQPYSSWSAHIILDVCHNVGFNTVEERIGWHSIKLLLKI